MADEPFVLTDLGPAASTVEAALSEIEAADLLRRLWGRDRGLWTPALEGPDRFGWLEVPTTVLGQRLIDELEAFAASVRAEQTSHVVLAGMGGSSLAPLIFQNTFRRAADKPPLIVLDSTDPAAVLQIDRLMEPASTLFVMSSKSGTTLEVQSFLAYYWQRLRRGERFCAITDPGSPLERVARQRAFRQVFLNPTDVEGRYAALSVIGLVPAVLIGLDPRPLLASAADEQHRSEPSQGRVPAGVWLGALIGGLARAGRNKLTVLTSPRLAAFPIWLEQLIAESTGKDGRGVVPIVGEPPGRTDRYAADRCFVVLRLDDDVNDHLDRHVAQLRGQHPLVVVRVPNLPSLGAEIYRWELATVVAAWLLGVNPYDAPNVQEGKDNTNHVLSNVGPEGTVPEPPDALQLRGADMRPLRQFLRRAGDHDYVALQAYLTPSRDMQRGLAALRGYLRDGLGVATTLGYGPRFLHSTGQLHKGGPAQGVFLQLTYRPSEDLSIPGQAYALRTLFQAQALGDLQALHARGRPVLRLDFGQRNLEQALACLPVEATAGAA
jgi:transaldolase / glucose-6-phosphate isomerase